MKNILVELTPFMKEIKNTMNYQESYIASVNESISRLTAKLEEHKNQTATELAHLQTSLNTSLDSLNKSLSNHQLKTENDFVQLQISTQNLTHQLKDFLEEHKNQTAAELAHLQTSLNTSLDLLKESLSNHQLQTEDNFDQLQTTTQNLTHQLKDLLEEHKNQTATELAQLQTSLNTSLDSLKESLSNHQLQTEDDFNQLQTTTQNLAHQLKDYIMEKAVVCTGGDNTTYMYVEDNVTDIPTCGGIGWRSVVYLDMTDNTSTCPSGWQLTGYSKRTCGRVSTGANTRDSTTFPVSGGEYSTVCGRIKAYQWASPDAFWSYHNGYTNTIDDAYVDGISLTHGNPRQHIWTFAAALKEKEHANSCPWDTSRNIQIPPFVGEDYFCEAGPNDTETWSFTLYSNNSLWDEVYCGESLCSSFCLLCQPPYFIKELSAPTTDDIEARICFDTDSMDENVAIEVVELYVQ